MRIILIVMSKLTFVITALFPCFVYVSNHHEMLHLDRMKQVNHNIRYYSVYEMARIHSFILLVKTHPPKVKHQGTDVKHDAPNTPPRLHLFRDYAVGAVRQILRRNDPRY